jgi:hypothetical protein
MILAAKYRVRATPAALTGFRRRVSQLMLVTQMLFAVTRRVPFTLAAPASEREMRLFSIALEETPTLYAVSLMAVVFLTTGQPKMSLGATAWPKMLARLLSCSLTSLLTMLQTTHMPWLAVGGEPRGCQCAGTLGLH